ncbi:Hypothetical protein SRM_00001 [Salinibacter ruber M8]|uniref:Uncharacterized protein n=1 Tax=Salinibacter ruber (strain M8) TaxID=761659 RepID=D5H4G7_SALRM|nr:Hypothetical protein SRM_00001 [Salinibacter ruber M8]
MTVVFGALSASFWGPKTFVLEDRPRVGLGTGCLGPHTARGA